MSGCYINRKGSRGGRGGGIGRGQGRSTPRKRHTKKTVYDYLFYVVSSNQVSYNDITAEFVVNHIKKYILSRQKCLIGIVDDGQSRRKSL